MARTGLLLIMITSILNSGCSLFGIRKEESPNYVVLLHDGNKEVRQYPALLVAQTQVDGEYKEAQRKAFRRLANYIFGDNQNQDKLAMTAPVTQTPASEKIAMTAPVMQSPSQKGWLMTFTMPSQFKTVEELPKPNDPLVELKELPPRTLAVIRYTGFRGEKRNQAKADELLAWLEQKGTYEIKGEAAFAGYDPPWTLPFFRRNEMMIPVTPK